MRATTELNAAEWRKATYSGGAQGDACIEVNVGTADHVGVRDSKDPHGPALHFPAPAWAAFLSAVKHGDLPTV